MTNCQNERPDPRSARFRDFENYVLAFLHDINLPFTNNFAEQNIRMITARLKISGYFCRVKGAEYFACIRSYFSTARKQGAKYPPFYYRSH